MRINFTFQHRVFGWNQGVRVGEGCPAEVFASALDAEVTCSTERHHQHGSPSLEQRRYRERRVRGHTPRSTSSWTRSTARCVTTRAPAPKRRRPGRRQERLTRKRKSASRGVEALASSHGVESTSGLPFPRAPRRSARSDDPERAALAAERCGCAVLIAIVTLLVGRLADAVSATRS